MIGVKVNILDGKLEILTISELLYQQFTRAESTQSSYTDVMRMIE